MNYKSHTSKGYTPKPSGPNMKGYYMGESSNLLNMMQVGGQATRGGAVLAQALQMQSDRDKLEKFQRQEAKRQKKGGLFGSIGGFAGGLLGGAIGGPAGAALGAGLFKGIGERVGAGKARDYDESGTVYMQDAFGDVDTASEDYSKGILGRALSSGAMTGLTAGLTPGGGMYGQYNPLTSQGRVGIKSMLQGLGVTGYTPTQGLASFGRAQYEGGMGGGIPGGDLTILDKARRKLFGGRSLYNLEDGGLIGMQYGGYTPEDVLEEQGLTLTDEQRKLFQQYDPTGIQQFSEGMRQNLLSGTQQAAQQQAGAGFAGSGATTQALSQQRQQASQALGTQLEAERRAFESQTLGTAADLISGGAILGGLSSLENTLRGNLDNSYVEGSDTSDTQYDADLFSQEDPNDFSVNTLTTPVVEVDGVIYTWNQLLGQYQAAPSQSSDRQLKENVTLVGSSDSGVNIYTFEYKDKSYGDGLYKGVMAQEVPWASIMMDNGYLAVDYNKVDVDFERVA